MILREGEGEGLIPMFTPMQCLDVKIYYYVLSKIGLQSDNDILMYVSK